MYSRPDTAAIESDAANRSTGDELIGFVVRQADPLVADRRTTPLLGSRAFRRVIAGIVLVAAAYILYERLGTSANADQITHFQSYADAAVAIGMTDDQPGFVLLSKLPASQVTVTAAMHSNWLTGPRTTVSVRTPLGTSRIRLRAPQAIMVQDDGTVTTASVPWTDDSFGRLLHAADCSSQCSEHVHRCGQPLEGIARTLASWPPESVPRPLQLFMARRDTSSAPGESSEKGKPQ